MPILNDFTVKSAEFIKSNIIDARSNEWFDKMIVNVTNIADGLHGDTKNMSKISIDILNKYKSDIINLGDVGVIAFINYIALGSDAKAAQMFFLKKEASLDELLAAGKASNLTVITAKKEEELAKEATLNMIKDIGVTVAQTLLPLLLAAI